MDSHELIDAQFDRAVEIVQNLPKNGPIQTGYEEKLTMYRYVVEYYVVASGLCFFSLFKQGELGTHIRLVSVLKHARPSNCWKCQFPETGNMGYAGSCEVVCPMVLCLPRADIFPS